MQITQSYAKPSTATSDKQGMHFNLSPELSRPPVSLHAMIHNSLAYGKIMLALREIVTGDWRSKIKDYTQYQEWVYQEYLKEVPNHYGHIEAEKVQLLGEKNILKGKIDEVNKVLQPIRKAMQEVRYKYYDYLRKYDKEKWYAYDPVISVHPDCVIFEAFSLDESSYGRVSVPVENLEMYGEVKYGTTNIDFSQGLADEIYRVRSYRAAWLKVAYDQVQLSTSAGSRVEKKIDLPESWVRGFLQVQSASTMPGTDLSISSATMNEILLVLEQKKEKESPRSIRFVLKKGEKPKIIIDPWGIEIQEHEFTYKGDMEGEVRIWGRRRLMVLKSLLAYSDSVQVKLLGTGMPHYWSVTIDGHRFDVGLSGWTSNDWSQKGNFDLLAATSKPKEVDVKNIEKALVQKLAGTPTEFAAWVSLPQQTAAAALQELCKNGQAMYDHLTETYRWRKLLPKEIVVEEPEEDKRLNFAISLMKEDKVTIVEKITDDKKVTEYKAEVVSDKADKVFKPVVRVDADGRVKYAECTCGFFRRNKLRQGPCAHIMAATLKGARS